MIDRKIHIIQGPVPGDIHPANILPLGERVALLPVYLRPDFPAWRKLRETSRDILQPWEPTWPEDALTEDYYHVMMKACKQEAAAGTGYIFHVHRAGDAALLGGVALCNVMRDCFQKASLSYWIGKPYARQGFMTEAVRLACEFAFNQLKLHRLEASCSPDNEPSKRLLRRLGFTEEGFARGYMEINGEWQDQILWGMIRMPVRSIFQ